MLNSKISGYLGFATKAGKLQAGYNTGIALIDKGRAELVIVAEDAARGTKDKIESKCAGAGTPYRCFGAGEELSKITGNTGSTVFTVKDPGFAKVIMEQIDGFHRKESVK